MLAAHFICKIYIHAQETCSPAMKKAILQVLSILGFESDYTSTALNKEISRVKKNNCDKINQVSFSSSSTLFLFLLCRVQEVQLLLTAPTMPIDYSKWNNIEVSKY